MEEIIEGARRVEGAPNDDSNDDPGVLEDELWHRSLMVAEIIERRNEERDPSRNGARVSEGDLAQDLDSAVEDMELQRSLMLSELSSGDRSNTGRTTPSRSTGDSSAAAPGNASEQQFPAIHNLIPRRDRDAEAVANLMAQITSATHDRSRAEDSPANSGWTHGARGTFDRLVTDLHLRDEEADQRHAVRSSRPETSSRSRLAEAADLLAAAFPDRRRQGGTDRRDASLANIVVAGGHDSGAINEGLWLSGGSGGSVGAAHSSGRVRAAIRTEGRLLEGISRRTRQVGGGYTQTVRPSPSENSGEDIRGSWQRRNNASHVDIMAEVMVRGGRSRTGSSRNTATQESTTADEIGTLSGRSRQNLSFAETAEVESVGQTIRRMGEAAHASLSEKLGTSLFATAKPSPASAAQESVCVVCLESPRSHAFVPCGHRCVCRRCMRAMRARLSSSTFHCPICRRLATDIIRIYL